MRILHLVQKPQLRGAEVFASQLGNHLLQQGHYVVLVSLFPGDAELPFSGQVIKLDRPIRKRLFDWRGWRRIAEIIREHQFDIVQANAGDTLKYSVMSKTIFRWKSPIIFRNANKISDFINTRPRRLMNKLLFSSVDHVISVSHTSRKDFLELFRCDPNAIDTVEVGIERIKLGTLPPDLSFIFDKGPVLVNVASLSREKNHAGLFRIFSAIHQRFPSAQLMLIGRGSLEKKLIAQAHQLGLSENVHFVGYRTDVMDVVRHCKVFVLPSFIEGLPAVILEAQYSRIPVVAYNVGGISEAVQTGKTGWLINKGDEQAFARAVIEVMEDCPKAIIDNAFAQVTTRYDNVRIASRFADIYRKVLQR